VIGWHKLTLAFKSPPLKVNSIIVKNIIEKAEVLRIEILERFLVANNLDLDPLID